MGKLESLETGNRTLILQITFLAIIIKNYI